MAKKGKFENKGTESPAPELKQKPMPSSAFSQNLHTEKEKRENPIPVKEEKRQPAKVAEQKPEQKHPTGEKKTGPQKTAAHPQEDKPRSLLQKIWEIVTTVVTYTIMAIAVAMMLFTAVSVSSFDRNDRDLFGYKFFIVRSDSMSATDFSAGDLVVIKEVDPATLEVGDIISFQSEDPGSLGETFTHKIRSFTTDDYGQRTFVTYGTTTGVDDAYPVSQSHILGQYKFNVPNMGTFFAFMKTTPGYICCIGIPFLLMLIIQGGSSVKYAKEIYKEKQQEEQSRLDALSIRVDKLEQQNRELREAMRRLYRRLPQE